MESKPNVDGKIGAADAINHGSAASDSNFSSNVTNANPLLKDSKRVIKKMIVMDTSKLKGLGIESTIKNAMSKLGKCRGMSTKVEKPPASNPVNPALPIHASSKIPDTIVKTEFEPTGNVTVKKADTVIKHIYRPVVPSSATLTSMPQSVPSSQPKSVTAKPATHHVIHLPPPSISATTNKVSFQRGEAMTAPVSVVKNVATTVASTNRMQPMIITSTATVPIVKAHRNGPMQSNCNAKIAPSSLPAAAASPSSQTNNPVIKVDSASAVPLVASDGKKIKVLSNVSLIDGNSKLLEIDKLTSKNLKLTNVIKGTDKIPPKPTAHPNSVSAGKPQPPAHSNAMSVKPEIDKVTKFTHVINKGPEERQPRTTVSASNFTRAPAFPQSSVPKTLHTEMKLISTVKLKSDNVHDEPRHSTTKLIFHAGKLIIKPPSTAAMPPKIEEPKFASKNLKISSATDVKNRTTAPNNSNFLNVTGGTNSDFINPSVRSSYPATKSIKTEVDAVPSNNFVFTNASKPAAPIITTTTTTRQSTTPMYSLSAPIKIEPPEEIQQNDDSNLPDCKASMKFQLYDVIKPSVYRPVTFTSSTSATTEVATKQLVTTDEIIEIHKPSAQKYLIKNATSVSIEQNTIVAAARNKRLHDTVWSTNSPRTYARHNIKRLLSDKIIKKSRPPQGDVQNITREQTPETLIVTRPDKYERKSHGGASAIACDLKLENAALKTETCTIQSTPSTLEPTPVDVPVQSPVKLSVQLPDQSMHVNTDSENVKAASLETKPLCNQYEPDMSVLTPVCDPVQPPIRRVDVNTDSVTRPKNNFYGFSIDEVNASFSVFNQIKAIISKKRPKRTVPLLVCTGSKVGNEKESKMVGYDSWILNHETGVLEANIDKTLKNAPTSTEIGLSQSNLANESTPKELPSAQIPKDPELDCSTSGFTPSKTPVIDDADDEISDIDLFHRSKTKCTGNTINRRAILKSIELHRKSVLPATTDDDEAELSLRVRPPRPKLKRARQKQTLEQLKVQQNAHNSLLKRFMQTDSDLDNLKDEVLMSFVDSVDHRIEVLENQVKICFKKCENRESLNVETIQSSEQSVSAFVDLMKEINQSAKPSESVTHSNELVKASSSNVRAQLSDVVTCYSKLPESISPSNTETAVSEHRPGQLRIHEVTIQRDTFLVTEYDNECDRINHLPLKVKLEKDSSTKPVPFRKTAKPTIRKKRKRKSLVEMLAKHVDKETLKSVIIAHANQKCDLSSSLDSDSEDDSDRGDVVSKIFRTVCTIDLCDDDDETLHEDVLQYLQEPDETEKDIEQDALSVTPSYAVVSKTNHELPKPIKPLKPSSGSKPLTGKMESNTSETSAKILNASSTTVIDTRSESSIENADVRDKLAPPSEKAASIPTNKRDDTPVANLCNEAPSISTLPATNVSPMETELTNSFDDDNYTEMVDVSVDIEVDRSPTPDNSLQAEEIPSPAKSLVEEVPVLATAKSDIMSGHSVTKIAEKNVLAKVDVVPTSSEQSKMEETVPVTIAKNIAKATTDADPMDHATKDLEPASVVEANLAASTDPKLDNTTEMKSPKRAIIKLRPFEEISCRPKAKGVDNEFARAPSSATKLSFEETLSNVDSAISKESRSKRKHKSSKLKSQSPSDMKTSDNSIDSNQNSSRLIVITPETSPKSKEQSVKLQSCSVSVNDDDSAVGAIKIKIKIGKGSQEPNHPTSKKNNDAVNGIPKPSRSRKRKAAVLDESPSEAITTPLPPSETTHKRPIFDNFDSPEILTTKRARKSKSYVDDDYRIDIVPAKPPPSNPRTSRRKSNIAKSSAESDPPKSESSVQKNIEEVKDHKDMPMTEPISNVTLEPNIPDQNAQPDVPVPVALTIPKSGRGIRPPILAPLNFADQYVCGNCKEEVEGKNWTKHIRGHYGLAWRVDVDPPIEMDNIHTMSSKVLNFIKKANIKILKCPKCDVEKKSALGYLSHLEVCGLTPEEIKATKLVKCEHCPSMIRSCSMKIHLTFCAGLKRLLQKEKQSTKEADGAECYNDMGRAVRRSAQKAMTSFKDLGKAPEAKLEDYVERVEKVSNKQHRKWRQLLKENNSIECVRNGCGFATNDMMSMVHHFNSCVLVDGETFYCSRCEHGPDVRVAIEEHIKASHSLGVIEFDAFSDSDDDAEMGEESSESEGESGDEEISDKEGGESDFDDEDDGWNTKGYKKKRQRAWAHNEVMLNSCLDRKVLAEYADLLKSYSGGSYFHPTLKWTQDFRDTHFSNKELLPTATPNTFSVLCSTLTDLYLPRIQQSNKFLVKDVRKYRKMYGSTDIDPSDDWKSLKRFEATKESDCIVCFTGGPVLSMAWLPVPDNHMSQILAVCCRSAADDDILLNNTKAVKCLIQIWNFDKLSNGQLRQAQNPHLLYSVAYDHGPVIQMEFCPSGGFTKDRLGLLAVSSHDGHVDILALPKNFTCDNSKVENLVFTIKPSLTLCCERDHPLNVLMTKLVWSLSKGHTKLAGGFSNGLVAIWNLKNLETPYICSEINGIPTLLPTDLFFAGNKTIRLLEFHHDENNEARWLIAGSHDRKVKFFDTHNVYLEISTTTAHSRIVTGCWPIHWTSFLIGIDNAYSLKVSGVIVKQPLDIGCRTLTFYSCIGSTCDISFNNWLNSYIFVTSYGDIHVGYVRQMVSGFGETRRQRSILGYTDAVDINRSESKEEEENEMGDYVVNDEASSISDEQQPSTSSAGAIELAGDVSYPSADGIVFCDFPIPLPAVTSPSYEKIGAPPMNTYNMVKVNRVVFNPNKSAYKLYALGYESGFVRINQLLPK